MTSSEIPLPFAMYIVGLCLTSPHNIARVIEFGSLAVQGPLPSFYFPSELARGCRPPDRGDVTLSLPSEPPGRPGQDVTATRSSDSLQCSQLSLEPEPTPELPSLTPLALKRRNGRTVSFNHKAFSRAGAEDEHTTVPATIVTSETNESIVLGTFSPAFEPLLSDCEPIPCSDANPSPQSATPTPQVPLGAEPGQDASLLWPSLDYDASNDDFYEAEYIADSPPLYLTHCAITPEFLDPGFDEPPLFVPPPPPRPLAIVPPPLPSHEPAVGPKKKRSRPRSVRKKKAAQSAAVDADLNALDSVAGPVPSGSSDAAPEATPETVDNAHDTASQPANVHAEAGFIPEGTPLWLPARHDVSAEAIEWDEFGNAFLVAPLPPRPLAIINPSDGSLVELPKLEKRARIYNVQLPKQGKCVLSRPVRTQRQDLETQPKKKKTRSRPRSARKKNPAGQTAKEAAAASNSDTSGHTTAEVPPSSSPTVADPEASPATASTSAGLVGPTPCTTSPSAPDEA